MTPVQAVEVVVAPDQADLVSGLLWSAGVTAVAEHPAGGGSVLLRTDVPPAGVEAVRAVLRPVGVEPMLVEVADDGRDAWREHASVVHVGRRFVVWPPWVPLPDVGEDAVVLAIDPGRSWGHGGHPTTRLCLAALERELDRRRGATVLDVGCGSGVLSVAAARLGAPVVACDIDDAAVETTRTNAARNDVAGRVDARVVPGLDADEPLAGAEGTFDVVVSNIGAAALVALAPHLLARLAPEGTLVLSGLLDPPPPEVAAAFRPARVARTDRLDDWTALVMR